MTLSVVTKLVLTVAVVIGVLIAGAMLRLVTNALLSGGQRRPAFWATQVLRLLTLAGVLAAVLIVWRDKLSDLGAVGGWFAAGLTVALQRVVTAFAG
jgi:hypothetical protein